MKVIDLLNKIANGEEVPKKIKVLDKTLLPKYQIITWNEDIEQYIYCDGFEFDRVLDKYHLNDEVEIIEDTPKVQVEMTEKEYMEYLDSKLDTPKEEKKILEKLGIINYCESQATSLIHQKVDEIIDYLKSKGE